MDSVQWKVEGMDCNTCALNIHKYLDKKGLKNIKVNFATGAVSFNINDSAYEKEIAEGIIRMGYEVIEHTPDVKKRKPILSNHLKRLLFCLPFTLLLSLHMIPGVHIHWLMKHWVQLAITIPVYAVGMSFFGKSAWKSIRNR
ncbi:MAG: cation transporter, partial [Chitinophagaceae bacterium]